MKRLIRASLIASGLIAGVAMGGISLAADSSDADLTQPLALNRAIQIALTHHDQIKIERSNLEGVKAQSISAKSALYPQITSTYDFSQQVTTQKTASGRETSSASSGGTQIQVQRTIYDMGKRQQKAALSEDNLRAAAYDLLDARQTVILTVTADWYELLRQRELVRVAESGVDRAKATLEATRSYVEAGTSARKDILQAESDYETAQVAVIEAENNAATVQTALKNAMGITADEAILLPTEALPAPDSEPDRLKISDYVAQAFSSRPDLKSENSGISANRRSVRIARLEAGPQFVSTVTEGYRIASTSGENREFDATVSYPLFDAGAAKAQVQEARANLEKSERQMDLLRKSIAADVETDYLQRESARRRVSATQSALKAAQENFAAASESRKEGTGTILDVITAQNDLVTAETNAVEAVYDYYSAEAALQRAAGGNDPGAEGEKTS